MNKSKILTEIAGVLQEHIRHIETSVTRYKLASEIDHDDVMDPEDLSRQAEASEMLQHFEQLLLQAKEQELFIKDHDNENYDSIVPGALIQTDSYYLYIGISVPSFQMDKKTVLTISENAPIYINIRGKKVGDTIKLGEHHHKILSIG